MNVLESERQLHEPIQDDALLEPLASGLLLAYALEEVPSVGLVHDDAETLLVHEGLALGHDEWVPQGLQHVHFVERVFLLFAVHSGHIDDFHELIFFVYNGLHYYSMSE